MINARHRFHGRNSLNKVYKTGRAVRTPYISLKYVERHGKKTYRVAVVVSRKVHKSAVKRNRIRRRVYETVRRSTLQLAGKDFIFTIFSEQVVDMEQEKLTAAIDEVLRRSITPPPNQTSVKHGIVNKQEEE